MANHSSVEQDTARAGRRFYLWLRWYMDEYPLEVPTIQAFADKIGVKRPTLSLILKGEGRRFPDFKTLIGARRVIGFNFAALLEGDPPVRTKR